MVFAANLVAILCGRSTADQFAKEAGAAHLLAVQVIDDAVWHGLLVRSLESFISWCKASMSVSLQDGQADEPVEERPQVEILGSDKTCTTFRLHDEDHTLGNALRYMLSKNKDVEFCGYSIPHPSDNFVNIRVQTFGKPAVEVFEKSLNDLIAATEHIKDTFQSVADTSR